MQSSLLNDWMNEWMILLLRLTSDDVCQEDRWMNCLNLSIFTHAQISLESPFLLSLRHSDRGPQSHNLLLGWILWVDKLIHCSPPRQKKQWILPSEVLFRQLYEENTSHTRYFIRGDLMQGIDTGLVRPREDYWDKRDVSKHRRQLLTLGLGEQKGRDGVTRT